MHWDPFLHAWVVTRYADVVHVLHHFSAGRTPTPEQLSALSLSALNPIAEVMVRQMLFLDPPDHTRLRALASAAFTPRRVEQLRSHIQEMMNALLDAVVARGSMDVIADFASPAARDRHLRTTGRTGQRSRKTERVVSKILRRCWATSSTIPIACREFCAASRT